MASGILGPTIAFMVVVGIAVDLIFFRRRKKEDPDSPASIGGSAGDEGSALLSSASLYLPHSYEFEVFLSFRGPDTRGTFTDYLYEDLIEKGVGAFRDEEGLRRGEEINSNLVEAIKKAKIYIPIFSKGYAESKWCLRELAQMVDCMRETKQTILPIFYDVTPTDVRNQTGKDYSKAFSSHKKNYPKEVNKWRNALQLVGGIKGWDLTIPANSCQGTVVKIVAFDVRNRLKKPLDLADKLTGIDDHVVQIMDMLDVNAQDVRVIGLWGIGGVGKTTVAKFIYNELMNQFDRCSFLPDVSAKSQQPDGLESLQKGLILDISTRSMEKISNVDDGKYTLKNRSTRKVLILLDDVDHKDQLEKLVPNLNNLDPGSRIIITTRYKRVLDGFNVEKIHEVTELNENDALELFCKHAFKEGFPVNDYFGLSLDIAKATGGLPLSIEVIGSYLCRESDKEIWQEALHKLRKDNQILSRLRISYDALDEEGKQLFLDIACLYGGKDSRISSLMWQACGVSTVKSSIKELFQRCLVKIGDDHGLWMHDHLKDLGREIVRSDSVSELGKRTRLWLKDDVLTVLENEEGTSAVKAIHLDSGLESEEYIICDDMLKGLSNLQFLELVGANLSEKFERGLSKLLWLGWNGCNNLIMPSTVVKLIILDLSKSSVRDDWSGWNSLEVAKMLQVVNLASCPQLTRTPDFSSFQYMKRLILQGCSGLVEVGPSVKHLKELVFLDLSNCRSLKSLPNEVGSLVALVDLLIDGTAVEELPTSIGRLSRLETLSAKSCTSLRSLPPSVGSLAALRRLWLDNCRTIVDIPSKIGDLKSLQELSLPGTKVANLPNSFQFLSNLKVLNINQCPIQKLPQSLWDLEKLEEINASKCLMLGGDIPAELQQLRCLRILRLNQTRVTGIPESIVRLSNLQTLDLEKCEELHTLPKLPSSLKKLMSPVNLPNLADLINLRQLDIVPCTSSQYEVFVSFSETDVTADFINDLYDHLTDSDFSVFINKSMAMAEVGQQFQVALMRASTSIVVISESYASSTRCLIELSEMVKYMRRKHQLIIPIFYGTEPCQLTTQAGPFAKVFIDLLKENDPSLVQDWRMALNEVAQLKGWVLPCCYSSNRDEIKRSMGRYVRPRKTELPCSSLIGMDKHIYSVMDLLNVEVNDVRFVGLLGMGGIGKSTLARALYGQLKGLFAHSSFIEATGGNDQNRSQESLQRQLVCDLSGGRIWANQFACVGEGRSAVMDTVRNRKVLIILEDVYDIEQLNNLAGSAEWFSPGSRIIITTRYQRLLVNHGARMIYRLNLPTMSTALELFCNRAFGKGCPESGFDLMSRDIVKLVGGWPLLVEILGSCLSSCRDQDVWQALLSKIRMTMADGHDDYFPVLKICYDVLNDAQKEIFLDVACLFAGMDKSIVVHVWEARQLIPPISQLQDLLHRSLIKVESDDNKLRMHNILRDVGMFLLQKGENKTRVWNAEEAIELLDNGQATENIVAISLEGRGSESDNCWFGAEAFQQLSNLWFLALDHAGLEGNFQGLLPNLRWLSWHGSNLIEIPDGLHLTNLVVLDLSKSAITHDWTGWGSIKGCEQLKVLDLTSCHKLNTTPDLSPFLCLKRLILQDCRGLATIHPSIGRLTKLEFIDMRNCRSLNKLPDEFNSLVALTELLVDETPIRQLPISSKMTDLETLSAKSCKYLSRLPKSLGSLPKLTKVTVNQSKG